MPREVSQLRLHEIKPKYKGFHVYKQIGETTTDPQSCYVENDTKILDPNSNVYHGMSLLAWNGENIDEQYLLTGHVRGMFSN